MLETIPLSWSRCTALLNSVFAIILSKASSKEENFNHTKLRIVFTGTFASSTRYCTCQCISDFSDGDKVSKRIA
jgi:hypothetical protein